MKRIWTALVGAFALCLALAGCGGGGGSSAPAVDPKADFVGTWEIVGMTEDGEETSSEELETVKAFGLNVYLELNDDGTSSLELFGEAIDGTWDATEVGKGTVTVNDESVPMTLDGGKLTLEQGTSSLTFEQIDPADKGATPTGTADTAPASGSGNVATYYGGDSIDDLDSAEEMDVAIVDDDLVSISVVAKGIYLGDPGFLFRIANKGDGDILVVNGSDDWAVDATARTATLYEVVKAGETLESIAWFEADEVGTDLSALTNISGTIFVVDANDTDNVLATYDMAF